MLTKTIQKVLKKSHFWRDSGFNELSELYVSNMLRTTALTIFSIFIPFYLYQHGYSAVSIFLVFSLFFAARIAGDIAAAYGVARFGPKHSMVVSCLLQIMGAALFLTVPQYHWPVIMLAVPYGLAASCFFIAYHVVFSKIKHTIRAGNELGHMHMFERIGYLIGPVVGGVIGSVYGPQYIFLIATVLLCVSLVPLFLTQEPVQTHQSLDFSGLPVHKVRRDIIAHAALGVENTLCINAWPFFVTVFVLSGAVYAKLGVIAAAGVLAGIVAARVIGRLSDIGYGRLFIRIGAALNASSYLVRPFASGMGFVIVVNIVNDALTSMYRMPFMKGMYAAADALPGYRIAYVAIMESFSSTMKALVWGFLALLATVFALKTVLLIGFTIAGVASLTIMTERFKVYDR